MRRPGWLSCARGRGAVLRGMRASARAVFAAGTSEIEKKKAGNVLTNITCLCFHYTIDEYGVSSLRKGRKCERNPSGVSFAFNSRAQATVCAADRFRSNKKRHAEACLFLLCFHYTIDEHTSCRSDSDQLQNQARFCKNVFSAIWITKSRSSGSAFAKSI